MNNIFILYLMGAVYAHYISVILHSVNYFDVYNENNFDKGIVNDATSTFEKVKKCC